MSIGGAGASAPAAQGTAVLVAGTVTVVLTSVGINSVLAVSTKTVGGTPGAVYVSTITPGVSFVITSTNAADTSTVNWVQLI